MKKKTNPNIDVKFRARRVAGMTTIMIGASVVIGAILTFLSTA